MSISSITTVAVARNLRQPTRSDAGSKTDEAADAGKPATLTDIVGKTLPSGAVAAYTAFIAIVSKVVDKPTKRNLHPDQYLGLRWGGFAVLILFVIGVTIGSYYKKAGKGKRFPGLELGAVTVAASAWGLALPDSPVLVQITDQKAGAITVGLIAFIGVAVNSVISSFLSKKAT